MSWWDSASGFTNLATAALKTAQKRIDKVLDIREEENSEGYTPQLLNEPEEPKPNSSDGFFDNWLGPKESSLPSMFLSSNAETQSPAASTGESLKEKLERKRAARAANLAKRNALTATKIKRNEGINVEKRAPELGTHPQSAFMAFNADKSGPPEVSREEDLSASQTSESASSVDSQVLMRPVDDKLDDSARDELVVEESQRREEETEREREELMRREMEEADKNEREELERLEQERREEEEQERLERERREEEQERKDKEEQAKMERERREQEEMERLEKENREKEEVERLEKEKREREEMERLEKEKREKEEMERLEKEKREREEMEREQQEREEQEKMKRESKEREELERLEREKSEKEEEERLEREKNEREEQERLMREEAERKEREELERHEREARVQREKEEIARKEQEEREKAEMEKMALEEQERKEKEQMEAEAQQRKEQEERTREALAQEKSEDQGVEIGENPEELVNEPTDLCDQTDFKVTSSGDMTAPEGEPSGWDDVSLSILTDSQFSSKCPSGADLASMVPHFEESLDSTQEQDILTATNAEGVSMETLESSDPSMEKQETLGSSVEISTMDSSTATESSLEVVTREQVTEAKEEKEEEQMDAAEGGDWNNEDLSISLDLEQAEATAPVEQRVDPDSDDAKVEESPGKAALDEEFLNREKIAEECSSTSETIDDLSESNRTLTADDIEANRCDLDEAKVDEAKEESREDEVPGEEPESCDGNPDAEASKDEVSEELMNPGEQSKQDVAGSPESHLSSSSYVKNMLEEAMTESVKDTDSHSSSDMVRIESAQNSGHTSADEIDTTTSSDIEIISHISTPTPNGDGHRMERPFDLSPLRHALSRSLRRGSPPGHKRSDSSSSGQSYHSRNGEDLLSPENHHRMSEHDYPHRKDSHSGEHGASADHNNPLETEKLLRESKPCPLQPIDEHIEASPDLLRPLMSLHEQLPNFPEASLLKTADNRELAKKLAEVSEVLDAREKKLVTLSQENVDLVEANTILRNQLQQAEEAREAEMEDLNALTEEFTQRIAETERTLQTALREKEAIKKKLREAEIEIVKRSDNTATERVLKEKEQVIAELLEEGEKLSKQQLQSNNIIKKLRVKEKENETSLKHMRQKTDDLTAEVKRLEGILEAKVENEKAQSESIYKLNSAVKKQEAEILRLSSELEDSQERCRSMKVTLDNSYKEITELHKAKATHASETQKAALTAEMQAKEELKVTLEDFQVMARRQQEALVTQIEDMQLSMSRMEKEQGRREDVLRQEISDLQQRLQEAESRNQELTQSVSAATRPLLRQIENLQSTYTAQSDSYEKVERNLTERLAEAQAQLAAAVEKERSGCEKVLEASMRLATLDSQVTSLRQEKSRLQAQLEMERTKVQLLEESKSSDSAQMEAMLHSKDAEISELKREKMMIENQLEIEKTKLEQEKKKLALVHEQLRDKELALQQSQSSRPCITPPGQNRSREGSTVGLLQDSPMSTSMQSLASSMNLSQMDDSLEKSLIMASSANGSKMSLYDSLRQTNATALVEHLQAQLKQREGEINQLQSDIGELEKTREAMARELVSLSTDKEDLQIRVEDLTKVQKKHLDLDQRYQALLQMYGEKVEEVQELRLDLQDIKDMYKAQINELLMQK